METRWRETPNPKNGGGTAQVKIEPIYIGNSKRPSRFIIIETMNSKELIKHLKNTPTGE